MMKYWKIGLLTLAFAMIFLLQVTAQEPLSSEARISVLTCDPGSELYSTFGHTAIRVKDDSQKMDVVFNYGIFDFNTPGFYIKFLRGKLNYKLGAYRYSSFQSEYEEQRRSVTEQLLQLDSLQKQSVFDFLVNNAKPENRDYKYDFFFDNCSTRARDIYENVLGLKMSKASSDKTFRNLLDEFLPGLPWSDFGIDLVIGAVADQQASQYHQTFLPDYLMYSTDDLQIDDQDFVSSKDFILDFQTDRQKRFTPPFFTPVKLFVILLLLEIGICFFFWGKDNRWLDFYDKVWYLLFGLSGLLLLFMWFGTDHLATKQNWNLLWLNPLFLLLLFNKDTKVGTVLKYLLGGLLICCLIFWKLIPQQFHLAFIPIILIVILKLGRSFSRHFVKA